MAWTFIDHVTSYLHRKRIGDRRQPTLWPSEASAVISSEHGDQVVGKCRRAVFFRYLVDNFFYYKPKYDNWAPFVDRLIKNTLPTDRYLTWIGHAGQLYEESVIGLAKDAGVYIDSQIPIYVQSHNISGKIDIVIINPETGRKSLIEAKSIYGFNADNIIGTAASHRKGEMGTPRDSNLMQIAIYQWWLGEREDLEDARLIYGARDTGRYAEFNVTIDKGIITYQGTEPVLTKRVTSPITIQSILDQYLYIQKSIDANQIPVRDYDLQYSDEKILSLYESGKLTKIETQRVARRLEQIKEGKKPNKQIEKGDWMCERCQYRNICYDKEGTPRTL